MKHFHYKTLKEQSSGALSGANFSPGKLVAISAGVPLALSLVMMLVDWLLSQQIGTTGGLGGMDRRALLSTIRSTLQLVQLAVLPFWTIGYTFAMLQLARGADATPGTLLQGFRKWGPVLRLIMLRSTLFLALIFVSAQIGSLIFMLTPWAEPLMNTLLQYTNGGGNLSDPAFLEQVSQSILSSAAVPLLLCVLAVFIAMYFLTVYRFRLAELCLIDEPSLGAMKALFLSAKRMKGNFWAMLRLDLRLWWYHGLTLLTAVLFYGDALLAVLGVALPFPQAVSSFLFAALGALGQFGLCCWRQNQVTQVYTHAYLILAEEVPSRRPY